MTPFLRSVAGILILTGAMSGVGAQAQDSDAGDLVFWQSIQNSTNPAEYQAYLSAFPKGKFAALARIRAQTPPAGPVPAAAPAQPAAPPPAVTPAAMPPAGAAPPRPTASVDGLGPVVGDGSNKIVATPATVRVGQKFTLKFVDFPDPNGDLYLVVPLGTPEFDPSSPGPDIKIVFRSFGLYAKSSLTDTQVGPFAPGKYEIRYLTKLYNNDGQYEASARTLLTVVVK